MFGKKSVCAIAIVIMLLTSSVFIFMSQNASAASVTWTSDIDFSSGNFFTGTGFETVLHETGAAAYVQNKKDMTNWIQKFPATNPSARRSFGLVNDSYNSRFILFGGLDILGKHNDTWEYDYTANNWVRICNDDTPACAPPRRYSNSMAYDNNSKIAVTFGGYDKDYNVLSDTWEFDVTTDTWTNRTTGTGPRDLTYHQMVYDAVGKQMILVGRSLATMEVWAYDAASHTWTQKFPSGSGPSLRSGFALGYSYQPNHKRVVLFGGAEGMTVYGDTYEYNPQTDSWSTIAVTGPSARYGAAMTYIFKPSLEGLILWGGSSWTTETWQYKYDPSAQWNQLLVTQAPSPGRRGLGFAYDSGYDALILFGGEDSGYNVLGDTWFLEAGYRLTGRYSSDFFNTGETPTNWQYIFWNQTPAAVPPNTWIRFQVNWSNICNKADLPTWRGPGGTPSTYYTTPGEALVVPSSFKCLRFLADMATTDSSVAAKLEDVTIIYTIPPPQPPVVTSKAPTLFGVQLNHPIYINFSRPMNINNVYVSITPNVTLDTPWNWYNLDTSVRITHNTQLFKEAQRYDVCVWGTDKLGQLLSPSPTCWLFITLGVNPWIASTTPRQGDIGISIAAPVVIKFSEPMDTSTCWPYVNSTPPVTFDGHSWNPAEDQLTLTHSAPFAQLTPYTIEVPMTSSEPCKDKSGLLLTVGPVPNPWSFTTEAINPYLVSTDPMNLDTDVPVNKVIRVDFSRFMQTASLTYYLKDLTTGANFSLAPQWSGNMTVNFNHATNFAYCRPYEMMVWALDFTGKSLIFNPVFPHPWRFQTTGSGGSCAPYMMATLPYHGERDVPNNKPITIAWRYYPDPPAGGMNEASFSFSVKDSYGNDISSHFVPFWYGMGPDVVELQHPGYDFLNCEIYTVRVLSARDRQGRSFIPGIAENPFTFYTNQTNCPLVIIWTRPTDNEQNAPLTQDFAVKFNQPVDTSTFQFSLRPDKSPYGYTWSEGDTNVSISHTTLESCEWYDASVENAVSKTGTPLTSGPVPHPWRFRGFCVQGPYINETYPANGQQDIPHSAPIWVNFSEPMNQASLSFTLSPSAGTLSYTWSNNDTTVMITHSNLYQECELYTARVVTATNKSGGSLVSGPVPNPWTFRAKCIPPFITSTIPYHTQKDVPLGQSITIVFSEPMEPSSLIFQTTPSHTYSASWPNSQTVVLTHTELFSVCTLYDAQVLQAKDLDGINIDVGPVPNPWNFTTDCRFPLQGLQVHREPPDNVRLTWTASPGVSYYLVFHSTDRLASWPWTEIANVTTNQALISGHLSDMRNHFYIVRGYQVGAESSNSTMGALWHPTISYAPLQSNIFWFSVPYNSIYKRASDITTELGPSKIRVIAKWNPVRQQSILYYYLQGQWRGQNFPIVPGDGLWMAVVSNFDWAVNGTDRSIQPLVFTYRPPPMTNYYWVGLPYTGPLGTAADLVISIAGGLGPGTNTKIIEVGKWNYVTQTSDIFSYQALGWGGVNFVIGPGDGIWILIVSTFSWQPELITPEVP